MTIGIYSKPQRVHLCGGIVAFCLSFMVVKPNKYAYIVAFAIFYLPFMTLHFIYLLSKLFSWLRTFLY